MKENLPNKESVTVFFCDIYGTIDGGFCDEDIQKFTKLLKKLKEKHHSDYLIFSMLSTEKPSIVAIYEKEISKYFDENIILAKKNHNQEKLRESKVSCAIQYLHELKENFNIDSVYCADDTVILQEMFSETLQHTEGISLNTIIPQKKENNLNFINEEIEKRFIIKNFKRNKKVAIKS